jgi:hypothetical protein
MTVRPNNVAATAKLLPSSNKRQLSKYVLRRQCPSSKKLPAAAQPTIPFISTSDFSSERTWLSHLKGRASSRGPLMFFERVELPQRDLVLLVPVLLGEIGAHVVDERVGNGGREVELLAIDHGSFEGLEKPMAKVQAVAGHHQRNRQPDAAEDEDIFQPRCRFQQRFRALSRCRPLRLLKVQFQYAIESLHIPPLPSGSTLWTNVEPAWSLLLSVVQHRDDQTQAIVWIGRVALGNISALRREMIDLNPIAGDGPPSAARSARILYHRDHVISFARVLSRGSIRQGSR